MSKYKNCYDAVIFLLFLIATVWTGWSLFRTVTTNAPDFSVLWLTTKDLVTHKNPYLNSEIFTILAYPPNTLILYLPLTLFPYQIAQVVFILLAFASVLGSVLLSLRISLGKISWQNFAPATSLVFLAFPTKFTLGMGQSNSIALLFLLLSYLFSQQKRMLLAGILLGLAISIKPILAFFLLFFLIRKGWQLLFYTFLVFVVLTVPVLLISNFDLYNYYFTQIIPSLFNLSGREIYYNQGILGFISRATDDFSVRRYLSLALSLFLLSITLFFTIKKKKENLIFSLFIITLLLVDTLSWQHHFVWLIFPFITLTNYALKIRNFLFLGLIGLSCLLVSWNFKSPALFSNFPWPLVLSNTFYGGLILFVINVYFLTKNRSA